MEGTYPGTFHEVPPDERGIKTVREFPGWGSAWHSIVFNSIGPFHLAPGDSIRLVYALVVGSISKQEAFEIARYWYDGICIWDGPDKLPPQYQAFPDLYDNDQNNWAKDCWVATGKDSLFRNASAAQWAKRQNYDVPIPPPPPDLVVTSLPDRIKLEWDGTQSEAVADFAGYRVYRCVGTYHDSPFYKIFECGEGTANPTVVNSYEDINTVHGMFYHYYVTAFDDGLSNQPDFHGKVESLESGKYSNITTLPAFLHQPAKIEDSPTTLPADYLLYQNYPNPFNPTTNISYALPTPAHVRLCIYNIQGLLIKTLSDGFQNAGTHIVSWTGTDNNNKKVSASVYFYRLTVTHNQHSENFVRKMIFTK